jgi:hypothetical protein
MDRASASPYSVDYPGAIAALLFVNIRSLILRIGRLIPPHIPRRKLHCEVVCALAVILMLVFLDQNIINEGPFGPSIHVECHVAVDTVTGQEHLYRRLRH